MSGVGEAVGVVVSPSMFHTATSELLVARLDAGRRLEDRQRY